MGSVTSLAGNITCGVPVAGNTGTGMSVTNQGRTVRDHFWTMYGPNQQRSEFEFVFSNLDTQLRMKLLNVDAHSSNLASFLTGTGTDFGGGIEADYHIDPPGGTIVAALDPGVTGVTIEASSATNVSYQLAVSDTGYINPAYQGKGRSISLLANEHHPHATCSPTMF